MATISELKQIEDVFLSKLPEGCEIEVEGQHDVIYFYSYKHSNMNDEDFLTKEEVLEIQKYRPGFHYSTEADCWAVFT